MSNYLKYVRENKNSWGSFIFFLRVLLGLAFLFRGLQFFKDNALLDQIIITTNSLKTYSLLHYVIPWIHLLGGLFIFIGLYTRVFALLQIPVLVGALIYVDPSLPPLLGNFEMPFTIFCLIFSILFTMIGEGNLSWKHLLTSEKGLI